MSKYLSRILLTLVLSLASTTFAKSSLWKLTKKEKTIYIQGSSHILTQKNYPLAPAINKAFDAATTLILEVDLADLETEKTQQMILKKAMYTAPKNLKTELDPAAYAALEKAFAKQGLPITAMHSYKPWFCTLALTMTRMNALGFNPELGLDKHFYSKAEKAGKKIIGLESPQFQFSLFETLSNNMPEDFIKRSLSELSLLETELPKLITAWETGDSNTILEITSASFEGFPKIKQHFITDRNKSWCKRINKLYKNDETYMVIVGSAHLPGKLGLIHLLEEKGFKAEQL